VVSPSTGGFASGGRTYWAAPIPASGRDPPPADRTGHEARALARAVAYMAARGHTVLDERPPATVLSGLVKRIATARSGFRFGGPNYMAPGKVRSRARRRPEREGER